MKIEYSGPRPIISKHDIEFNNGKEDNYVYLMISIQILQAIDKNYEGHKSYSYDTSSKRFSDSEIHNILTTYETTLEQDVVKAKALSKSVIINICCVFIVLFFIKLIKNNMRFVR